VSEKKDQNPITRRFPNQKNTVIIDDDFKRQMLAKPDHITQSDYTPTSKRIALFILGMVERVDFERITTLTVGRFDRHQKEENQLDLTDYGAVNRGVSRVHCQLEYQDGKIVVTDLGSTNGTYVNGKRLDPNQPYVMARGDELVVGRLPIQIVSGG